MDMSPQELAKAIAAKNLANLAKKVNGGGTLNKQEMELLTSFIEGKEGKNGPVHVQNQTELAEEIGVTRKTIQRWLKIDGNPGTAADGRYNVPAWKAWAKNRGHEDDDDYDAEDKPKLQAENLALQNERLRENLKILKEQYIDENAARQLYGKLVISAKSRSYSAIARFVAVSRLAESSSEASAAVRKEMDAIWLSLTDGSWNKETPQQP